MVNSIDVELLFSDAVTEADIRGYIDKIAYIFKPIVENAMK